MSTAAAYPHIVKEPDAPAYLENHPRTRVAMIVMDYLARGLSPEEIVRHYPYLKPAEVHSAMGYYHDHRDEIESEIQAELDELDNRVDGNEGSAVWLELRSRGWV
jgi:hypothetical protein